MDRNNMYILKILIKAHRVMCSTPLFVVKGKWRRFMGKVKEDMRLV